MKYINVGFDDHEIKKLKKVKGSRSWHDFIMLMQYYRGD